MLRKIFFAIVALCATDAMTQEDYPVNFPADQAVTHGSRRVNSITLHGQTINVRDNMKVRNVMMDQTMVVRQGESVKPSLGYNGVWMNGYLYIDRRQDGQFDVEEPNGDGTLTDDNDLVSYSYYNGRNSAGEVLDNGNCIDMPSFVIPTDMPAGYYRMRFKLDWDCIDPGGSLKKGNELVTNGGAVIDVRLRVVAAGETARVNGQGKHGEVAFHNGVEFNDTECALFEPMPVIVRPEEGHCLESLCVRHGDLAVDSLIHGVPQYLDDWYEARQFNHGKFEIPSRCMDGEVLITAIFRPVAGDEETETETWALTFSDEFNAADGTLPDNTKWACSGRGSSTWKRYVTDRPEVAFQQDGHLVTRCIPDPDREEGSTDMISGAIESRKKYSFRYGRAEARLKTIRKKGNFPAFWMMPENTTGGWPTCGEIDIFEAIDAQNRAWHTIHSNWSYTLGHTTDPKSSANEWVNVEDWHTYALEWEPTELRWYVDEKQVFAYTKSTDADILAQGQWPFDKAFYLILNQSVGNGSWAAWQDPDFTYETRFDYVRVYQLRPTQFIPTGIEATEQWAMDSKAIYDLSGRMVADGEYQDGKLPKGIYIRNGRKFVVR